MHGDQIFARTIGSTRRPESADTVWQYHPRSDAHSKAACWGVVFDLLQYCQLFREHVSAGKVCFGINHEMRDFQVNRKKNLDLVIGPPGGSPFVKKVTFSQMRDRFGIELTGEEDARLKQLSVLVTGRVASVLVALEAKACMTEHLKARPRLYDELSSSEQTIHGDTESAIAAALVAINLADSFVSPLRNPGSAPGETPLVTPHDQPKAANAVVEKISELKRRSHE